MLHALRRCLDMLLRVAAGALSDALAAVRWAAGREGQSYNIKVRPLIVYVV
jgi:hypothetical protein